MKILFISMFVTLLNAAPSLVRADDCTLLSGGRELLTARRTIQVGNVYYNLAVRTPDLITQPGTCVSTPPAGIVDPVLSVASMGTNTFRLPENLRAQLVVSQWVGSDLREVARVTYSTILVSKLMVSVLIVPIENVYYDFSDPEIQGDFARLPKEITSFYEVNFRFFLASGPASFQFHEPDPANPGDELSLQADDSDFQNTATDDTDTPPTP